MLNPEDFFGAGIDSEEEKDPAVQAAEEGFVDEEGQPEELDFDKAA